MQAATVLCKGKHMHEDGMADGWQMLVYLPDEMEMEKD
jgi:hypothetical protein